MFQQQQKQTKSKYDTWYVQCRPKSLETTMKITSN